MLASVFAADLFSFNPYVCLRRSCPKSFLVQNDEKIFYINYALRKALKCKSREFWGARGVLARNRSLRLHPVGIVVVVIIPVRL